MSATYPPLGERKVPGEVGIWGFLLLDLGVFSSYFMVFLFERAGNQSGFLTGTDELNLTIGVVNTIVLLTSSLFVALAVQSLRHGRSALARKHIVGASLGGWVFIINKPIEWGAKIEAGFTPGYDVFFQLYYMMTGLHLLHVIVGMFVLYYLWKIAGSVQGPLTARQERFLENGAIYWHLVDLIWLVLFALFYVIK